MDQSKDDATSDAEADVEVPTEPPMRCLVVMPAFNEELSLDSLISEVRDVDPSMSILVVDDHSTDRTVAVARQKGVEVVELPFNLGVGGAMRCGFRYAVDNGFDVVIQIDADGQHPPKFIPDLVAGLTHSDIVIGARFAGAGSYEAGFIRRQLMKAYSTMLSQLLGTRLTDVTSGFRATGPRAVPFFADVYPQEYLGDTIESLVLAGRAGLDVSQVPVEMRQREHGEPSQTAVRSGVHLLRASVALAFIFIRRAPSSRAGVNERS